VGDRFKNSNHVFVWVNGCTVGWKPGTPANYVSGFYVFGYNYNGGGKTVEGTIRRAEEAFDAHVMEFTSRILARAFGNDMNGWRAPYRATKWDD
jgi:ribosomal protein L35AE/L33A